MSVKGEGRRVRFSCFQLAPGKVTVVVTNEEKDIRTRLNPEIK